MTRLRLFSAVAPIMAFVLLVYGPPAVAVEFTTSYQDGGSWNSLYAQGFKASMNPNPDPGHAPSDVVRLDRFQFFKSGNADVTASFRLAILNNYFVNLRTLTTSSPELEGLSTNIINGTTSIATGDPITFEFDSLELLYGDGLDTPDYNYAAVFVTVSESGALTPILVPVLIADYIEDPPGSGMYRPESDYGDPDINYFLSASNYLSGDGNYFVTFNAPYADATFIAYFDLEETTLPGDFNQDGMVDAADYVVWRKNDINGAQGYQDWRANFGMSAGALSAPTATGAVPEPHTLLMAFVAVLLLPHFWRGPQAG